MGDVVALPGVGLAELDLPLGVVTEGRVGQVARPRVQLGVGEGPLGAGQIVDEVPALRRLPARQDLVGQALGDVERRLRHACCPGGVNRAPLALLMIEQLVWACR